VRGDFGATLAAFRAYRRLGAQQRTAAAAKAGVSSSGVPKAPVRRSVVAMGQAIALVVAAVVAISFGVSEFGRGAQPQLPYAVVDPSDPVPATSLSATAVSSAMSAPAQVAPLPAASPATGSPLPPTPLARGAGAPAATGSAPLAGTPAATASAPVASTAPPAVPAASPSATVSPVLVSLCQSVVAAGTSWPSVLKGADRATVIAAAGKKKDVLPYCTALLANTTT
jgi:hypothetical protein